MVSRSTTNKEPAGDGNTTLPILLKFFGGEDPDSAAVNYEAARARLVRFFEYKGAVEAPELADQTLDRVAVKLAGGEQVNKGPIHYLLGFARLIFLEYVKLRSSQEQAIERAAATPDVHDVEEQRAHEARVAALERCLGSMVAAERQRTILYYRGRGQARIDARTALAATLEIPQGALRIRMHRTRQRLQTCIEGHLSEGGTE